MKQLIDIGNPNAPEGSEPWCRAFHLSLCRLKHEGEFAVSNLKYSLREFRDRQYFKTLVNAGGEPFEDWQSFVQAGEPYGLGMSIDVAQAIIDEANDKRLLKDILKLDAEDRANQRPVGPPKGNQNAAKRAQEIDAEDRANARPVGESKTNDDNNESNVNNCKRPSGNSPAYALRRLRRHSEPGEHYDPKVEAIYKRVLAGELSPHAGMVEAGFRKKAVRKKLTALERIRKLLPKLTATEYRALAHDLEQMKRKGPRQQDKRLFA